MPSSKFFLRWIVSHLFAFLLSPFCFMLAGWVAMALLSVQAVALKTSSSPEAGPTTLLEKALFLLAPLLTGLLLGGLVSGLQSVAMRNTTVNVKPFRWVLPGMLGLGLAFPAFAWTYSSPVFAYPFLMAVLFSACVYGLACALPQAHLLTGQVEASWRWLLLSLLAALLAIPLVCAPVWLAEGPPYFWLVFSLAAAGGTLFGFLTGVVSRSWL